MKWFGFLLLVALAVPCSNGQAQEPAADGNIQRPAESALTTEQVLAGRASSDFGLRGGQYEFAIGNSRKYLLHIPASYNASRPTPLVLFLHGGGGHMEQAAADYGWREKADREGFVVAFPNGSSRVPGQRIATWNAVGCCGYARDR
ncbi:MAG: polyhydroxybutyrate depolymerase [Nitrospirae bacterium]|nr:MAG: polyhydroxybutyrate depolymerase [Nitrospirota bacterium]